MWRRPRNNDQNPSWNRSNADRRGARRRDRLTIRSCCFMRRLCATTVLAPPGPKSLAIVHSRWARSSNRSFMLKKGSDGRVAEQGCRDFLFQATISNSRQTAPSFLCLRYFTVWLSVISLLPGVKSNPLTVRTFPVNTNSLPTAANVPGEHSK
jgi:hypothetical protein